MTIFIPGDTLVDNARSLTRSALPDAPVVADEHRRGVELRARAGALLRFAAQRQQWLADRLDPVRLPHPQPGQPCP